MPDQLMSDGGYITASIVLFLIGICGFSFNFLVIVLFSRDKQLWKPLNKILFNVVLSDFSIAIFGNPLAFLSAVSHGWLFGRELCVSYGFLMALLGIVSITTLAVLSFERYLMITQPFSNRILTHNSSLGMITAIWAYSLALTTPPLLGWGEYVPEAANISCSVNWEVKTFNSTTYILFLFAFGLVVPLSVIIFSYLNILRTIRKNVVKMGRVSKAESHVARMVFVMIVMFLVAWTPYAIFALLVQFSDIKIAPGYATIPSILAKSSICYNPLIYVGLNSQFRSAWRRLLRIRDPEATSAMATTEAHVNITRNLNSDIRQSDTKTKSCNSNSKTEFVLVETSRNNESIKESHIIIDDEVDKTKGAVIDGMKHCETLV